MFHYIFICNAAGQDSITGWNGSRQASKNSQLAIKNLSASTVLDSAAYNLN